MHLEDEHYLRRMNMVERQIVARGVRDFRVIEAFRKVSRHLFVPPDYEDLAYSDSPLPIGEGQTISQPYIVALMLELLTIKPEDQILEIGTGSGYQTALLAELAGKVYTVERVGTLLRGAQETLRRLGYTNVFFFEGDGTKGLRQFAPYDKIIVSACARKIYESWIEQLVEGGIMVLPLQEDIGQILVRGIKKEGKLHLENHGGCVFVPLIEN